jgi:glycosyltransferase involved in cell wall biosynthesis
MFVDLPSAYSASVRVNGAQFVPWFHSQGWVLKLLPPFPWKALWWLSGQKGLKRLMWYGVLPLQRCYEILFKIRGSHLVIVHKCLVTMQKKPVLETLLRRRHRHVIFNYDDAVYEKGIPYVSDRIRLADAVWVGNPILIEYSKRYCDHVALIESAVDCSHYSAKEAYVANNPLQLIWSGTAFSQQYLEVLRAPLKELGRKRKFVIRIVSGKKFSFCDPDIVEEWIPFDEQREVECLRGADIALMPITDGPYERAKENYKVKMYKACGLPLICSPVGINTHFVQNGERGLFASTPDEWVSAIERLADSQPMREKLGREARRHAVAKYDIPVIGRQLLDFFEAVLCAE